MTNCWLFCTAIVLVIGTTTANSTQSKNATEIAPPSSFTAENKSNDKLNSTNATVEIGDIEDEGWEFENTTSIDTRRILYSKKVQPGKKPYMVYLQLTKESAKAHKYRGWLCGGVIVHANYVLTSAACIEDADRFYIVSGTTQFVDSFDYKSNDCVCKNRRKVVWKCIPKNYKFDFQDSIKWSSNDIAIVKVDKPFKFGVNEKGCEFATDSICYNNISRDMEKPGTKGFIVGWGSGSNFREGVYRRQNEVHIPKNAKCLQEAKVCIMDNEQCAKKWAQRFRSIITQYMICTKDVMRKLSEICDKRYANCTDVESRRFEESQGDSGTDVSSKTFNIDVGRHLRDPDDYTARRSSSLGGFCENDHGGPLIVKYQGKERVIGVISACKIDPKSHSCHGPFLYTSVFKNRQFISCAIHKDVEENCRRVFRSGITHEEFSVSWDNVEEDDDDIKVGADKVDKSSDDSDERDVLREASNNITKIEKKEKSEEVSSSSSEEEKKVPVTKAKEDKKDEKKRDEVKPKNKSKSKKSKKHGKSKAEKREITESKKNKGFGEPTKMGQNKGEVFYESSKDENVNEPNED